MSAIAGILLPMRCAFAVIVLLTLFPLLLTVVKLREGVTNVIRHSRARECLIRLVRNQGMVEAMILNDGEQPEDRQDIRTSQSSGLAGLRERVAALGGTMDAGSLDVSGKKHFRLWVAFPLQAKTETREAAGAQEKRA